MDLASANTSPRTPLKILSLDGGGIRGISSLLILERIMEKIRDNQHLDIVPRPCDYFDLIGGTSTGGIIAIMLGRLRMTVDECIRAYRKVAQQAFSPKLSSILPGQPSGAFSSKALEAVIKEVVREFCTESRCVNSRRQGRPTIESCSHCDLEFLDQTGTKTVVLAITKDNVDAPPTLFKTYDRSAAFSTSSIWQVARATSAATTFFKPIEVGRDGIKFIDAGFGYNNPCEILIRESRIEYPQREGMLVLSIGSGLGNVVTIQDTRLSILNALQKMATSSQKVAANLSYRYAKTGQYYRFNVDHGLQDITISDWKRSSSISAHTRNYLDEIHGKIEEFIDRFTHHIRASEDSNSETDHQGRRAGKKPLDQPVTRSQQAPIAASSSKMSAKSDHSPFHYIPFLPNACFEGRTETLNELKRAIFSSEGSQSVAIFGLGGIGKTQVALQLAYWAKKHMPSYSILWIPAISYASFEQACVSIAKRLSIPQDPKESSVEALRRYLSSEKAVPWLIIVDNADNTDLLFGNSQVSEGIKKLLPANEAGVTLFTTRSRSIAVSLAGKNVIELREMTLQEATGYLEKSLIRKISVSDGLDAGQLSQELNLLPLAITQAVAYMNTVDISISKYLQLLRGTKSDIIGLMSREFYDTTRYHGAKNAVAATWFMSFNEIRKSDRAAAELLSFISCIEPKAIPVSILPPLESEEQLVHAIGTLCGYAFLVRREDDKVFDMHSLVHLATQIWIQEEGAPGHTLQVALNHIESVFPLFPFTDDQELWQAYLPHARQALQRTKGDEKKGGPQDTQIYGLRFKVGTSLSNTGQPREGIPYLEDCWEWSLLYHSETHAVRIICQQELVAAYHADGQVRKATQLVESLVDVTNTFLDEHHPFQLESQARRARLLGANGQIKQALELLEHVATAREKFLDPFDPLRLMSQCDLADAYLSDGQVGKSIVLFERIAPIVIILPEQNHLRMRAQHVHAKIYEANGQAGKAVELLEHLVAIQAEFLDEDDLTRLEFQMALGMAYKADRQMEKAIQLLENVVLMRDRTLHEHHPSRLQSQYALASAYLASSQTSKAVQLLHRVVTMVDTLLPEGHYFRFTSKFALAEAYQADGQEEKEIELLEHIVITQARSTNEGATSWQAAFYKLARAYQTNAQTRKAIQVLENLVELQEENLPEEDHSRLHSQYTLAKTYLAEGHTGNAVQLLEKILSVQERMDDFMQMLFQITLLEAYQADGEDEKATQLTERMDLIREEVFSDENRLLALLLKCGLPDSGLPEI